jgi:hypothetical protein
MGKLLLPAGAAKLKPFTAKDVANRELVLQMLRHEDAVIHSEQGKAIYQRHVDALTSLVPEKTIHRVVLKEFGFDTTVESVETYRTIFAHYYESPAKYDREILTAVTYLRENRTVFYTEPAIEMGSLVPDAPLLTLADGAPTSVTKELTKRTFQHAFIGAFSTS